MSFRVVLMRHLEHSERSLVWTFKLSGIHANSIVQEISHYVRDDEALKKQPVILNDALSLFRKYTENTLEETRFLVI